MYGVYIHGIHCQVMLAVNTTMNNLTFATGHPPQFKFQIVTSWKALTESRGWRNQSALQCHSEAEIMW